MADGDSTLGRFERQCATCEKVFKIGTGRGQARKYCAESCWPPRTITKVDRLCIVDGCGITCRSTGSPYCEKHYGRLRRTGTLGTVIDTTVYESCQYCGQSTGGRKFCDSRCDARSRRGHPLTRQCMECGKEYSPLSGHGRDSMVCGAECGAYRKRRQVNQAYHRARATEEGRDRLRRHGSRRRARKRKAFIDDVSREEVMRRCRWVCHLCGERIPKNAEWPAPMFGTVDHVIPLADGGEHSYANCKAAHLTCNCRKGARARGQLGLPLER